MDDALSIEARLPKGVNLVNERMRYALCCRSIQAFAAEDAAGAYPTESLGDGFLQTLHALRLKAPGRFVSSRMGACFFPPERLAVDLAAMEALAREADLLEHPEMARRLAFFKAALEGRCGVVETTDFLPPGGAGSRGLEVMYPEAPVARNGSRAEGRRSLDGDRPGASHLEILKKTLETALRTRERVNLGNQPHECITEALRSLVERTDPAAPPAQIRIVYLDGSEAQPFPLRCLDLRSGGSRDGLQQLEPISASLVSMRHLDMDDRVDFAWFRNRKVSRAQAQAEIDAYCTETTLETLRSLGDAPLHLHLYQTGLETAVVGFYRGLVLRLLELEKQGCPPDLLVVPHYFRGEGEDHEVGTPWL